MHFQNDNAAKRFNRGLLLTWIPFLLFMIPIANVFRGISNSKATGLAAVAGGMAEGLATFGFAAIVITQVGAIVVLTQTLRGGHFLRNCFSVVSIICSVLLISFMVLSVWLIPRFLR